MGAKSILAISLFAVLLMGIISFDDAYAKPDKDEKKEKQTKLQKECAKDPKSDDKIKAHCELLGLIGEGETDPREDSFFDVFFDVEAYSVDSFFDIFTELQTDVDRLDGHVTVLKGQSDSFFDVFFDVELYTVDSFFDIFTELQTDVARIDTEMLSMDLRGQSCNVGDVVIGIDVDGQILCALDQQGGLGSIQDEIDVKNSQIIDLENQIAAKDFEAGSLQIQLDALALPPHQILQCQQHCAALNYQSQTRVSQCAQEASALGLVFEEHCSAQITAANTPCTCPTTSDPVLADQLVQQIASINTELDMLNDELEKCQFELMVLETLQNHFPDEESAPVLLD